VAMAGTVAAGLISPTDTSTAVKGLINSAVSIGEFVVKIEDMIAKHIQEDALELHLSMLGDLQFYVRELLFLLAKLHEAAMVPDNHKFITVMLQENDEELVREIKGAKQAIQRVQDLLSQNFLSSEEFEEAITVLRECLLGEEVTPPEMKEHKGKKAAKKMWKTIYHWDEFTSNGLLVKLKHMLHAIADEVGENLLSMALINTFVDDAHQLPMEVLAFDGKKETDTEKGVTGSTSPPKSLTASQRTLTSIKAVRAAWRSRSET